MFEMETRRSLECVCVLYLLARLTEIYQTLPHRVAEVLKHYMKALVSLRIFGWPPLPSHREGYQMPSSRVIAQTADDPEIFPDPDSFRPSAMN